MLQDASKHRWYDREEVREVAQKKVLGLAFAREAWLDQGFASFQSLAKAWQVLGPLELAEELLRKDVLHRLHLESALLS